MLLIDDRQPDPTDTDSFFLQIILKSMLILLREIHGDDMYDYSECFHCLLVWLV